MISIFGIKVCTIAIFCMRVYLMPGITVFNSYIIVTHGMIIKHCILKSKPSLIFKG